ncbi:MAG TPA: 30S ribosomal protein S15 [Candidatus Azoamicus sp. OHIO2]
MSDKYDSLIENLKSKKYGVGSIVIQVVLLSKRINSLTIHLKKFKKDLHSKYGLIGIVSRRKKLLKYLKLTNEQEYFSVISLLELRK